MSEKIFADGFIFKNPHKKAPEFVKGRLSIKAQDAIKFIQNNKKEGWLNLDLKESKGGKLYFELDTYNKTGVQQAKEVSENIKKEAEKEIKNTVEYPEENISPQDIPF